jgi:hypothetical protein
MTAPAAEGVPIPERQRPTPAMGRYTGVARIRESVPTFFDWRAISCSPESHASRSEVPLALPLVVRAAVHPQVLRRVRPAHREWPHGAKLHRAGAPPPLANCVDKSTRPSNALEHRSPHGYGDRATPATLLRASGESCGESQHGRSLAPRAGAKPSLLRCRDQRVHRPVQDHGWVTVRHRMPQQHLGQLQLGLGRGESVSDSRCSTLLGTTGVGRGESPTRGEFGGGRRSVGAGGAEDPMAARRVGRARSVFRGAGAGHQVSTRDNAARASISCMVFPAIFAIQSPAYSAVTRLATVHNPHTVTRASEEYAPPRGHRTRRLHRISLRAARSRRECITRTSRCPRRPSSAL